MKIIVECTPEEARRILGLPNLVLLQESFNKAIETKMQEIVGPFDPLQLTTTAVSMTLQGFLGVQKAVLEAVLGTDAQPPTQRAQRQRLLQAHTKMRKRGAT